MRSIFPPAEVPAEVKSTEIQKYAKLNRPPTCARILNIEARGIAVQFDESVVVNAAPVPLSSASKATILPPCTYLLK